MLINIITLITLFAVKRSKINCEDEGLINHIDWYLLLNSVNNEQQIPDYNVSINVDKSLKLSIDIFLQYIGTSTDSSVYPINNEYILGTSYVIGFASFPVFNRKISEPYNCDNRLYSSFDGINDFKQFWNYSQYPYLKNNLGSKKYLSYPPPSKYWALSIKNNKCSPIHYYGIFKWFDLLQCVGDNNNTLIKVENTEYSVILTTTIYISIVSPFLMNSIDSGYYRTYNLVQQDIKILVTKFIDLKSSLIKNIDLFTTKITAIWINNNNEFIINILIESADYLLLTQSQLLSSPFIDKNTSIIDGFIKMNQLNYSFLVESFINYQLYEIKIPRAKRKIREECPSLDFTGTYSMGFIAKCASENNIVCNSFVNDHNGDTFALDVKSEFTDNSCIQSMYNQTFESIIKLYKNQQFDQEMNITNTNQTIYVEMEIITTSVGNWTISAISIENIFLCAVNQKTAITFDHISVDHIIVDHITGYGACILNKDNKVITESLLQLRDVRIINESDITKNKVRLSFLLHEDFKHKSLIIQIQCGIKLENNYISETDVNRSETDQIRHFIAYIDVKQNEIDSLNKMLQGLKIGMIFLNVVIAIIVLIIGGVVCYRKQKYFGINQQDTPTPPPVNLNLDNILSDAIQIDNILNDDQDDAANNDYVE